MIYELTKIYNLEKKDFEYHIIKRYDGVINGSSQIRYTRRTKVDLAGDFTVEKFENDYEFQKRAEIEFDKYVAVEKQLATPKPEVIKTATI